MKKNISLNTRYKYQGVLFASPFILGCIAFFIYPILKSMQLAFGHLESLIGFKTAGFTLDNFNRAFVTDIEFVPMFVQTIKYTFTYVPLIITFSLMIAILVNSPIKCRFLFRVIFFLPFLLGTGTVMKTILNLDVQGGAVNVASSVILSDQVLSYIGPQAANVINGFLGILTLILWKTSVQILLFLSGLQNIPESMYEAAKVDSANSWDMFWKITFPIITPVILLCGVYSIIDTFYDGNNPIIDYIYNYSFVQKQFEYSSALSWIYAAFALVLIGFVFLIMKNRVYKEK